MADKTAANADRRKPSKRSDPLQREMTRLRQKAHAMQCLLDGRVVVHHRPEDLLKVLQHVQPDRAEPPEGHPRPQEGLEPQMPTRWRQAMRRYTEMLEFSAGMQAAASAASGV